MAKKKKKKQKGNNKPSTQKNLDIAQIKENTIVMRDGSLRGVLLVSSINFALKSEDEQNAIISSYVGFLNNIDFNLQIVVQSREMNIEKYLDRLAKVEKEQTNELLKAQTADYIDYIKELISLGKIMNKKFFIIVPYNPLGYKHKGFFRSLAEALKPSMLIKMKEEKFKKYRKELDRRIDNVMSGLNSMGLNAAEVDTQSLIELFYNTYNPDTSSNQKMPNTKDLRVAD
jgi:type IV secretory pathway VirB4 component